MKPDVTGIKLGRSDSGGTDDQHQKSSVRHSYALAIDSRKLFFGIRSEEILIADEGADAKLIVVEPTESETLLLIDFGGAEFTPEEASQFLTRTECQAPLRK